MWPPYRGTRTADQADLAKLGFAQLNLMWLHSTLVWQLLIIEHEIDRRGGRSWKRQRPLDKPHDDDDDDGRLSWFSVSVLARYRYFISYRIATYVVLYKTDIWTVLGMTHTSTTHSRVAGQQQVRVLVRLSYP